MDTLTLTQADLAALVAQRVAELLAPARVEELAREVLDRELALLDWEAAAVLLQCRNRTGQPDKKQLQDYCGIHRIPVQRVGKKLFLERKEIAAFLARNRQLLPDPQALSGTKITRIPEQPTLFSRAG